IADLASQDGSTQPTHTGKLRRFDRSWCTRLLPNPPRLPQPTTAVAGRPARAHYDDRPAKSMVEWEPLRAPHITIARVATQVADLATCYDLALEGVRGMGLEPRRVEKPWGYEIWWAHTESYAGKLLYVKRGHRLSLQYHVLKDESCYLLSGRI